LEGDIKVFNLISIPVSWQITKDVSVKLNLNGIEPGQMIQVTDGDKVRIMLNIKPPESTLSLAGYRCGRLRPGRQLGGCAGKITHFFS